MLGKGYGRVGASDPPLRPRTAACRRAGEAFRSAAAAAGYQLEHIPAPPRGTGPDELLKQLKTAVSGAHSQAAGGLSFPVFFSPSLLSLMVMMVCVCHWCVTDVCPWCVSDVCH